jgi:hypothetical protein
MPNQATPSWQRKAMGRPWRRTRAPALSAIPRRETTCPACCTTGAAPSFPGPPIPWSALHPRLSVILERTQEIRMKPQKVTPKNPETTNETDAPNPRFCPSEILKTHGAQQMKQAKETERFRPSRRSRTRKETHKICCFLTCCFDLPPGTRKTAAGARGRVFRGEEGSCRGQG